jgi:hypothetical protein
MSDQEPIGKRMIGQLREHTEPYRPAAWEHFERMRERRGRKKRILMYWMSAAALLVIFGTALLVHPLMNRRKLTGNAIAEKQIGSSELSSKDSHKKSARVSESKKVSGLSTEEDHANNEKQTPTKRRSLTNSGRNAPVGVQDFVAKSETPGMDQNRMQGYLNPGVLEPRPFSATIVNFRRLYVSAVARQEEQTSVKRAGSVRFGIGVSQQANQAVDTDPERNYVVGGSLNIPLTPKLALMTGFYGSKQSLNLQKQAMLSGAAAEGLMQLQRARYHWTGLEAPLHLQYRLRTFKKVGIAAVGGISLQGSVGQVSDYFYKTSRTITTLTETAGGPVVVSTQTVEDFSSVTQKDQKSKWTLGSSLYLGLGMNYQLQNTAIEVEPYIKYPVGTVTAEKLRLTSIGIQLRLTRSLRKARKFE